MCACVTGKVKAWELRKGSAREHPSSPEVRCFDLRALRIYKWRHILPAALAMIFCHEGGESKASCQMVSGSDVVLLTSLLPPPKISPPSLL